MLETVDSSFEFFMNSIPCGIMIVDEKQQIVFINNIGLKDLSVLKEKVLSQAIPFEEINQQVMLVQTSKKAITNYEIQIHSKTFIFHFTPQIKNNKVVFVFITFEKTNHQYDSFKELNIDINAIFESSYDVIYVSDASGKTLRVSSACKRLWGKEVEELIGKDVRELEKEGVYNPSITRMVLESKEKINTIQTTKTGKRLLVSGTPITDEKGNLIRVVNVSRDITELSKLQAEIDDMKVLIEGYKRELRELKNKNDVPEEVIYKSKEMEKVVHLSNRVAEVDSTVLINGESGVGKEVIANIIHKNSHRSDLPFLKINCGAIPEALLESELFGYEKGSFTGANREGKLGIFEYANGGTLFLDEIGEMPFSLQVKMLRVLQEQEITRIGGKKPIKIDVRIIAATNRDLKEEVKNGRFREDLYYRLNVFPIYIPPLRKRREDIIPLIFYFVKKYNQHYLLNKTLDSRVLEVLQGLDWPGNIRELQNIIERLMVISDGNEITLEFIPDDVLNPDTIDYKGKVVEVHEILPLKECIHLAEQELLTLAKIKYSTTVEIAKELDVDQSTISRKLKKLNTKE